jgi:hypothetical protein
MSVLKSANAKPFSPGSPALASPAGLASPPQRIVGSAEETLEASLTADKWKWKYEQVLEMGRLQGVKIDVEHFQENDTVEDMRLEIHRLKEELQDAKVDAAVAKATAEAVVMGDGDLSAAEEMALRSQEEGTRENDEVRIFT